MAEKTKKTCYYELLGLERKCEAPEIKTAYRKLALKLHPDKAHHNGYTNEEATRLFQQIQEAHSVLSDPQERAWYDAHREQILKGDDEPGEDPFKTKINLYKHFSASCFDGFGDGAGGFFAVYAHLFGAIDQEEKEWKDVDEEHVPMPLFGSSKSEWADVSSFYRHWLEFCSRKAFAHADKWNPREASSRQVRRAMEQENKKARQAAKKEFNNEVRQLAKFVQKRDPRVAAHQKEQMRVSAEKTKRELQDKEQRKAQEAKEKRERKEASRLAEEKRWREVQAEQDARRARGEVVTEDEEEEEEEEALEYRCEPCRKTFKSEKAFDQHSRSKKHLQIVAKLRQQLEEEVAEEAAANSEADEVDLEAGGVDLEAGKRSDSDGEMKEATRMNKLLGPFAPAAREAASAAASRSNKESEQSATHAERDGDDSEDGEEDDEDDFLARFAARKQQSRGGGGKGPDGVGGGAHDEDSDVEGSEGEDAEQAQGALNGTGSKKAQKRAKQKALLLEKKAEKESVQELVSQCKKVQKATKEADGEAAIDSEAQAQAEVFLEPSGSETRCCVCNEDFPSRTKLFAHIKATGHAALKAQPDAVKGKKKKR